ncbi:MAG: SpoIIE family protein phosphatase [Solibacillus sp.]
MAVVNEYSEFLPLHTFSTPPYTKKTRKIVDITFVFIAFCLAQATFFEAVVPFFLPFWIIVRSQYKSLQISTFIGGLVGTLFLGFGQVVILLLEILLIEGILRFKYTRISPYIALTLSIGVIQTIWQVVTYAGIPPLLTQVYVLYEWLFALVMLLLMTQLFVPLSEMKNFQWAKEKVIAMLVVFAAVLVGMQSVTVYYFSLPIIAFHLVLCVVAAVSTVGTTVIFALSMGLLLGVAHLSFTGMIVLYACTGLFTALMKDTGRFGIAIFSMMPSVFFFFYDATLPVDSVFFLSILMAVVVFVLLPKSALENLQQYYEKQTVGAGTIEVKNANLATEHLKQFQQFVSFMKSLVFERFTKEHQTVVIPQDSFMICSSCFRYEQCWGAKREMENTIENWRMARRGSKPIELIRAEEQLKVKCIKSAKLLEELETATHKEHMERQFYHGKKMIALQLRDLSHHLEELLDDRHSEVGADEMDDYVQQFLKQHQMSCIHIEWIKNDVGSREFICSIADDRDEHTVIRQAEQLLYELLHEPLQGQQVHIEEKPLFYRQIRFRSAIRYQLEYDIYKHSKGHQKVSGDSYSVFPIHTGLMAIMLSDGMGTSNAAQRESSRLIQMMQECLSYNMDPETAMHTMHYVLSLKNDSDMYATIDFALVDLQLGSLWCWKAGGMTTYVLRGADLIKIESKAAPIGFLPDFSVDTEMISVLSEDIIIMVSDGLFASQENWMKQEELFLQLIRQGIKKGASIQVVLYDVMAQFKHRYPTNDDCTVMLFQLRHIAAPWSVFRPTYS